MTEPQPATTRRTEPRTPLVGMVVSGDEPIHWAVILSGIGSFISGFAVIMYHATLYFEAGVPDVMIVGPIASQSIIVGATLAGVTLWRWGHPLGSSAVASAVALAAALGFGVLPHLILGRGWVTTLLGTLFSLTFWAASTIFVWLIGLYRPSWWMGWHHHQ